jgi:N4-(beta-N-acetylglucosaminyl)-L-asparaginase
MPQPLMLATWSFGRPAIAAAWEPLASGGSALDAVETACRFAEDDPGNHTVGPGSWPDRDGRVSLDAMVMLSPAKVGGVCFSRRILNPVTAARRVMERTNHNLLAGDGADAFADEQGLPTGELISPEALAKWRQWKAESADATPVANIERQRNEIHDTIGVLAMDATGLIAGGCTTSGLAWKLPGRVGDSPIIGHGLYVDPAAGACVCTGHGERVSGICGSFLAVEVLRNGGSPEHAINVVIDRMVGAYSMTEYDQVGLIVLDKTGRFATGCLRPGYQTAVRASGRDEIIDSPSR